MFLNRIKNSSIGLDISDLSLKMVVVKQANGRNKIQAMGRTELPAGLIEGGEIKNAKAVADKIKGLVAKPKFGSVNTNEVAACLPETKTFVKLIRVEKDETELARKINSEIEKHVPMSVGEIYYDWQVTGETDNAYSVLIGAAPRYIVNQYIDLLRMAGFSVVALEAEPVSICRALLREESPRPPGNGGTYAIIDIGAKRTSMIIYAEKTVVTSVSMPISGNDVTARIAKILNIDRDQAEKAKIICGLDKQKAEGIIFEILSDTTKQLLKKIKGALSFYRTHYRDLGPVRKILLCGGGSNVKNLDRIISESTSIETGSGDPFTNLDKLDENLSKNFIESHDLKFNFIKNRGDANLSVTQNSSLTYATAIGLALRDIFIAE